MEKPRRSSTGTAAENRILSTDRANSVLNYLLTQQNAALDPYAQYFCAAGYGATRPVADNNTDAGRTANRRIEISMILKDETVLDIVENYLALEVPDTQPNSQSAGETQNTELPAVQPVPTPSPSPSGGFFNWFG